MREKKQRKRRGTAGERGVSHFLLEKGKISLDKSITKVTEDGIHSVLKTVVNNNSDILSKHTQHLSTCIKFSN